MAIIILKWIADTGDVLIPLSQEEYNNGKMVSANTGTVYFPIFTTDATPTIGNPMGLLLTLTYAA